MLKKLSEKRKFNSKTIVLAILALLACIFLISILVLMGKQVKENKQISSEKKDSPTPQLSITVATESGKQKNGATLVKKFEGGELYKQSGINIITLSGSFRQMGREYGALLGDQIEKLYQDALIKPFVHKKIFKEKELLDGCKASFQNQPKRQKELLTGISETSGLSLEKVMCASDPDAIMMIARLEMAGNINSCTSGAVWGKYTADGKTLTVRNFDFPSFFRDLAKNYATIVIFKPTDGSNALAGVGFAGSITFGDMMNDKGLYVEANNGADSAGLVLFANRIVQTSQITNLLFETDNPEQFDVFINSNRPSYSTIYLVADPISARYYELASWDVKKRESDGKSAIVQANQFKSSSWGIVALQSPAAWFSSLRESNLANLITAKTQATPKDLMKTLDVTLYNEKDWTMGKGAAVIKKNPKDDEVTVWQVVTKPSERKLWLRLPTITDWILFDLNQWFKD